MVGVAGFESVIFFIKACIYLLKQNHMMFTFKSVYDFHIYIGQVSPGYNLRIGWVPWRLKSPESRLCIQPFVQAQTKESIKTPRHWPSWGNSPVTSEFPAQRVSNAENVSIWWRHHDGDYGWIDHNLYLAIPPNILHHNLSVTVTWPEKGVVQEPKWEPGKVWEHKVLLLILSL